MSKVQCSECKTTLSSQATQCPRCGHPEPGGSTFLCDKCAVPNNPIAEICRGCGASLEGPRNRETAENASIFGAGVGFFVGLGVGNAVLKGIGMRDETLYVMLIGMLGGVIGLMLTLICWPLLSRLLPSESRDRHEK